MAKAKAARPSSVEVLRKNVKLLRGYRGLTQETLAEMAGLSNTQISQLERGQRSVVLATIDRLADAFQVEPWELLRPRDDIGR